MITLKDVRNRDRKQRIHVNESLNFPFYKQIAVEQGKFFYMKNIMECWRSVFENDENASFEYLMETLDSYLSAHYNNNDYNQIINILKEDILPSLNKGTDTSSVKSFDGKYTCNLSSVLEMNRQCDRILNNHKKLNSSFNFDTYIREHYTKNSDEYMSLLVHELYEMIDSIKMNDSIKINVALENIKYGLYKVGYENDRLILESIVNKYSQLENKNIETLSNIIARNDFYSQEDKAVVNYVLDENTNEAYLEGKKIQNNILSQVITKLNLFKIGKVSKSVLSSFIRKIYVRNETQIVEDLPNIFSWIRQLIVCSTLIILPVGIVTVFIDAFIKRTLQRDEVAKAIQKVKNEIKKVDDKIDNAKSDKTRERLESYKKELQTNLHKLEDFEDSLLSERERDAKFELDEACYIDDKFVSFDEYQKSYHKDCAEKIGKIFTNMTIGAYVGKVDYSSIKDYINNVVDKESMAKHLNANGQVMVELARWDLSKQRLHLMETVDDVREMERRILNSLYEYCRSIETEPGVKISYEGDDEEVHIIATIENLYITDRLDLVDDITLEDAAKVISLEQMCKATQEKDIYELLEQKVVGLDSTSLRTLNSYLHESVLIDENKILPIYNKIKRSCIEHKNISKDDRQKIFLMEGAIIDFENYKSTKEAVSISDELGAYLDIVQGLEEGKIRNNLRIASIKGKQAVQRAKDFDDKASNILDNAVDRFYSKAQKELTDRNREAVIRGKILPSFSSLIKLALGSGLLGFINPVLSVITFVGGLAISKRATEKERQYILDEIEINLKLVDRKIQLAESNNDMKALEQLLKIQRKLRQEKQRIMYKGKMRDFRREMD